MLRAWRSRLLRLSRTADPQISEPPAAAGPTSSSGSFILLGEEDASTLLAQSPTKASAGS